jgi:hypothetical protein
MLPRLLCCLFVITSLSACGKWDAQSSTKSPNGGAVALVEVKLRGASSSNLTRISVANANGGTLISPGEVVSADGAIVDATRVSWSGPNELRVVLCEAMAYQVRASLLRDPVTLDDGSENALSVKVENWRYSEPHKRCIRS